MTPQQLKASILKYAMQGKLVEQKPEDGTGEDGNKTKDNLESAVEESANLLTRILRRCAELNKLPDVDNLAFRVDKQKQGIKCKILVP